MTEAEHVERLALALWTKPNPHLPGAVGSVERWEACQREAQATFTEQRRWAQTGDY